jgi:hypothetical protein
MIKTQMTMVITTRLYLKKTAVSAVAATLVNFITIGNPTYEEKRGNITASVTHAAMPYYQFSRKKETLSFYTFEHTR